MRKNKGKTKVPSFSSNTIVKQSDNEYDVRSSLNKVRPYTKRHAASHPSTKANDLDPDCNKAICSVDDNVGQTTGGPTWDRYDRLEDKISDFSAKNEIAHGDLRKELEEKIEKSSSKVYTELKDLQKSIDSKLSKQWYSWTIAAIVAIVAIIWLLSYSKIVNFVEDAEERLIRLELHQPPLITTDTIGGKHAK